MKTESIKRLVYGGLLAAVIAVLTFSVKLPVPVTHGYVHPGDGAIFLAAALMGPYAAVPAAVGSALADLLGGYYIYMLPTAIIKGAMGLISGRMMRECRVTVRNVLVFVLCELIMTGGYFLFECVIYGAAAAAGALIPNLIQGAAGVLLGSAMCAAAKTLKKDI